jgi:hypothetical protein
MDVIDEFDINIIKRKKDMHAWPTRQLLRH